MNQITDRTPQLIAAEINGIKEQTRKMLLYNSIEIGRRLVEAKSMIEHGEWGEWLEKSVDYSQRTANNLMRIFEEYGSNQIGLFGNNANSQTFSNLTYSQAIALLGVPQEEREEFIKENDVENMSTRELQQAIKERDQANKELEIFKRVANEKAEEALKLIEEKQRAESDARLSGQVLRNAQADVKMLQDTLKKEKEHSKEQIAKLQSTIADIKEKLSETQASGNNDEAIRLRESLEKTDNELEISYKKIAELERQLKEKPIEVSATTVVEKIPEEVERELNELRQKASQRGDTASIKFKVYFDDLVKNFQALLGALAEIAESAEHERYKEAVIGLIGKMSERL